MDALLTICLAAVFLIGVINIVSIGYIFVSTVIEEAKFQKAVKKERYKDDRNINNG